MDVIERTALFPATGPPQWGKLFMVVLLNLINIGSTTAFFAILSQDTLALYISYILPILFLVIHKVRGQHIPYGAFKLPGGPGLPINIFAICYAIFIAIFLPWPRIVPVSAVTMNYSGPVVGAVILFALLHGVISGRKRFQVPVKLHVLEDEDDRSEGSW